MFISNFLIVITLYWWKQRPDISQNLKMNIFKNFLWSLVYKNKACRKVHSSRISLLCKSEVEKNIFILV